MVKKTLKKGRKPTIWPKGVGGRGKVSNVQVPTIIKNISLELAKVYVLVKIGDLTIDAALDYFKEVMIKDLNI